MLFQKGGFKMIGHVWITILTVAKLSSGNYIELLNTTNTNALRILVGKNGRVYIHTGDTMLQFNNLSLQPSNLAFKVNNSDCFPGSPSVCPPSVFEMITLEDDLFLMVCGSAYDAKCLLHIASNISNVNYMKASVGKPETAAMFGSPISSMILQSQSRLLSAISPAKTGILSGCTTTAESLNTQNTTCNRHFALSQRMLRRLNATHFNIHYENPSLRPDALFIAAKPNISFRYIYGFHSINVNMTHNYYLLKNRPTSEGTEIGYIIQICANSSYFASYTEAKIECNGYKSIVAATALTTQNEQILYVVFKDGTLQGVNHMCVYRVHAITDFFDDQLKQCFHSARGSAPDWIYGAEPACKVVMPNTQIKCGYTDKNRRIMTNGALTGGFHSLTFTENITCLAARADGDQGNVLFVLGTNNGTVHKTLFDKEYKLRNDFLSVSPTSSRVESLTMDPTGRAVFYISKGNVIKLALDDCGIHSECAACLRDRTEVLACKWSMSTTRHGKCVDKTLAIANDTKYFVGSCPPIIQNLTPTMGPTAGGTRLTITGHFGPADATLEVYVGNASCKEVDQSNLPTKLACVTPPLSDLDKTSTLWKVLVRVNVAQNMSGPLTVPVEGETDVEFTYLEPWLNVSEPAVSRLSGGVQLELHGANFNIGSNRSIVIGKDRCDVTKYDIDSSDTITCRTPKQNASGFYNVSLHIDDAALSGVVIHYTVDPDIITFVPLVTTESGGIKITVSGERINGLGFNVQLTAVNNIGPNVSWILDPGKCSYENTSLVCITGKLRGDLNPNNSLAIPILVNIYGWLTNNSIGSVRVIKDPVLVQSSRNTTIVSNTRPVIEIQGSGWSTIPIENFRVTVNNAISCHVRSVNESIVCEVEIDNHVFQQRKPLTVKCSIGFRIYAVGTVSFSQKGPDVLPSMAPRSNNAYMMYGIIAGSVVGCLVLVTCIVCSVVKYSRYKSRRLNSASYNVHFRRDDRVLSLEGLSESHNSDAAQNRQNDYQQRLVVNMSSTHEHSSDKDTAPLLQDIDPEILQDLEEKGLLIDSDCLILGEPVGEGNFGQVFKAYLRRIGEKVDLTVAAKTMHRSNPKDLDVNMFIREALIMKDFEHKNVMQLVGICFGIERLPLVILPFLPRGDLLSYIRNVNNVPRVRDLVMYGVDIANGMQYLAELKFVHRDLAARNCMLADDMTVKVSDFGLSRDVYEREYYSSCDKTTKLPVKWMSPESLEFGHYSSKSDVWSYGVVLWELLTRGMCPYPAVDNWDIMRYLKSGRRLEKPEYCPDDVYQIMLRCWQWEPEKRPAFSELVTSVPEILCRRGRFESSRGMSESSDCK
ncbi:hepatocyte growth factor receptor-like [Dreissena polymorpha]|uniref:receptor protein-tyrosine kinase n=1 Tax=Dreissena polymorpha TaxID=45954 RepID=A0A9D4GNE2_DREPO|nr:hepatocyte growth factor receptor-like [Dreissena polymorpha]KAH3820043.1 hypothetical protein DPMN_121787 [Dreissena polymorpha]